VAPSALLDRVFGEQAQVKAERRIERRIAMSGLPERKTLEGFDWAFQRGPRAGREARGRADGGAHALQPARPSAHARGDCHHVEPQAQRLGPLLGDPTVAAAILDRLAMRALRLDIDGPSFRQHVGQERAR